ncbi:hypothetical protein PAXINDRAFT_169602 [Paxillus involutus ATCC 200175]|uniref:Vacuolar sorting protein 39/Transforming growth factor beta receptor-associated domain-containing protein n=1 Tax=Paxillus involutus ATCC 200175 TaxID=664439 RepID=A0A0C9U5L8_PAXIN|nr:hypothetical protein PAXINDRAFT_169602 [Paxillus involutus ATCC 200175]
MSPSSYPRSFVLLRGQSSIYSLLPSTLFAQVESLLQNGAPAEAEALLNRAEAGLAHGSTSAADQTDVLRYLHQCLAFTFMRRTRFGEAAGHFVRGAIDPRVIISYFDELRPALFDERPSFGSTQSESGEKPSVAGAEGDYVEVEVWDGVREYMPQETSVDDLIAINLVRNYSPYLRPGALPASPSESNLADAESLTSDSHTNETESGTRTHPATIAMRQMLRAQAQEMVKEILSAVLGSAEGWAGDIIEITSTALALLYAHARDADSLLALFAPPPRISSRSSSRPVSRSSSRPPSRPSSSPQIYPHSIPSSTAASSRPHHAYTSSYPSHDHQTHSSSSSVHAPHASYSSQSALTPTSTLAPSRPGTALPFRPKVLAPALVQLKLWGTLIEMWKVVGEGDKIVEVLVGLVEGKHVDPSVVDPLEEIFGILTPTSFDPSSITIGTGISLNEQERRVLVRKWGVWLAGKDVEKGLKLLTSVQPTRTRRPTGAAGRGKDKEREQESQKADELAILSELRHTNVLAAKRYLEWLILGRSMGRGGKETTAETELFEELVWSCVEEALEWVGDEAVGRLWRAKATSYTSSPSTSTSGGTSSSPPPPSKSPSPSLALSPPHLSHISSISSPPRPPFLSYFASTTPNSPSKRARIKALLVLQSLNEGRGIAKDIQDRIVKGGWEKVLSLEMAILSSKIPSPHATLGTLHALRDASTAESYALSGGATGVVSTKVGVNAAEGCGLADWGGWFGRGGAGGVKVGGKEGDLLKMLLEVYMEDGDTQQTARLLSSQAGRLDVIDIIQLVPPTWPLHTISTYLTRSLRSAQHISHETQIVKAICAGQNLAVLEQTFEVLREEGAIVEEAVSDDEEGEGEKGVGGGEGGAGKSFDEKVGLHLGERKTGLDVVDVHVDGGET